MSRGLIDYIIKQLDNKVVHITTFEAFQSINKDSFITPNINNKYSSPFGDYNGYFKSKGCVSFFDYRDTKKYEGNLCSCSPADVYKHSHILVALELSINKYKDLITWDDCKKDGIVGFQIVPNIEVGLRGNVSLDDIRNVIKLTKPINY